MKITKEEKSLWNFLNIFRTIFSKTSNRTIVYGMNNTLYLYTLNYAGKFISKESQDKLMADYVFDNCFYELKQLPSGQFVLDMIDDSVSQSEIEKIISMINEAIYGSKYRCELNKNDEFKIAKITETTGLWMSDNDVRYINAFPHAEIYSVNDSLVIQSVGINDIELSTVSTCLIFNQLESVHTVQQKINIEELSEKETVKVAEDDTYAEEKKLDDLISEAEEEFEDDFDPMSV